MGARGNELIIVILRRTLAAILVLAAGVTLPWYITAALGCIILLFEIASLELIFIGAILDAILHAPEGDIGGFFFSLLFFAVFVMIEITSSLFRNND